MVNESQKTAALPARNKAVATATQPPTPDSARWASNVAPSDKAMPNAQAGKAPAPTQSMTAFASPNAAKAATEAKPAGDDAKPAAEVKSASLTPAPTTEDSETSSIPDERNGADKAHARVDNAAHESVGKVVDTGGRHVVVTTATNLRAGPENHSHVLVVVPAKASVELFSCDQWCKVAYDGREGYIYKEFVRRPGHVPAVARSEKPATKVASTGSGKLIGGAVVKDESTNAAAAPQQPAATAAKPAQPAATELPPTMQHQAR